MLQREESDVEKIGDMAGNVLMMNKLNNADRRIAIPPFRKRHASKKFCVHIELGSRDTYGAVDLQRVS
jgi:hypothetical protein